MFSTTFYLRIVRKIFLHTIQANVTEEKMKVVLI
jgi:hypothetical protein